MVSKCLLCWGLCWGLGRKIGELKSETLPSKYICWMLSVGTERFGIETQAHNGYNLQLQQQGKTTHTKNRNVKWLKMHHNYIYSCETIYIYMQVKNQVCVLLTVTLDYWQLLPKVLTSEYRDAQVCWYFLMTCLVLVLKSNYRAVSLQHFLL